MSVASDSQDFSTSPLSSPTSPPDSAAVAAKTPLPAAVHPKRAISREWVPLLSKGGVDPDGTAVAVARRAGKGRTDVFLHGGRFKVDNTPSDFTRFSGLGRGLRSRRNTGLSSRLSCLTITSDNGAGRAAVTDLYSHEQAGGASETGATPVRGPALEDHVMFLRGPLIFLHGGRDDSGRARHELHAFHRERRCWIAMRSFGGVAAPRLCGHGVTALNPRGTCFLLAGVVQDASLKSAPGRKRGAPGAEAAQPNSLFSVFQLDFREVRWSVVPTTEAGPGIRYRFSLTASAGTEDFASQAAGGEEDEEKRERIFLVGGQRDGRSLVDVWTLSLRTGVWRTVELSHLCCRREVMRSSFPLAEVSPFISSNTTTGGASTRNNNDEEDRRGGTTAVIVVDLVHTAREDVATVLIRRRRPPFMLTSPPEEVLVFPFSALEDNFSRDPRLHSVERGGSALWDARPGGIASLPDGKCGDAQTQRLPCLPQAVGKPFITIFDEEGHHYLIISRTGSVFYWTQQADPS